MSALDVSVELSICIASYNARDSLMRCLAAIRAHPPSGAYEIVLVVDESGDGTAELVRTRHPDAILITNPERVGMSRSHNQAFRRARGVLVLQLGADTQVQSGALDALVAFMRSERRAGIAGARLVNPDGSPQPTGRPFPTVTSKLTDLFTHQVARGQDFFRHSTRNYERTEEVDEMCNACLLIRRDVFEQVGYLDENYFLYFDDVEFSYRVKQGGWKVFQVVEALVTHAGGVSYSGASEWAIVEGYRSELVFWSHHGGWWRSLAVRAINLTVIPLRLASWLAKLAIGRLDVATLRSRLRAHGRGAWLNLTYRPAPPMIR